MLLAVYSWHIIFMKPDGLCPVERTHMWDTRYRNDALALALARGINSFHPCICSLPTAKDGETRVTCKDACVRVSLVYLVLHPMAS